METQEIEVTIGADGGVHVSVRGVKGRACLDLTRDLEAALGDQVERRMTHEADEQPARLDDQQWAAGP